jgi:hypothetical protein
MHLSAPLSSSVPYFFSALVRFLPILFSKLPPFRAEVICSVLVLDRESGEPISGALLRPLHMTAPLYTDDEGIAKLPLSKSRRDKATLVCKSPGYRAKVETLPAEATLQHVILLSRVRRKRGKRQPIKATPTRPIPRERL